MPSCIGPARGRTDILPRPIPALDKPVQRSIEEYLLHFVLMQMMFDLDLVGNIRKPNEIVDPHYDNALVSR